MSHVCKSIGCQATIHSESDFCRGCIDEADRIASSNTKANPLKTQIGGGHYKNLAIQPIEYIHANGIPFAEGSVIKYVTRHKEKNKEADIRKAIHCCQLILKLEYGCDE